MSKGNLIVTQRFFPLTIGRYIRWALEDLGYNIWTAGTFSDTIPWAAEKDYSAYIDYPDFETPEDLNPCPIEPIIAACPFKPDAILSIDASFNCLGVKETNIPNALILTDPHALESWYRDALSQYETIVCMQETYKHLFAHDMNGYPKVLFTMPYAADHKRHYWNGKDFTNRPYDVGIVSGLIYKERGEGLRAMEKAGLKVAVEKGVLYEEYSEWYGNTKIAFNWSSERDLCARFWEGMAMRNLVLTNRIPELQCFPDLKENVHYLAYGSVDECVEKALYYTAHQDEAWAIASAGYSAMWAGNHFWTQRVSLLMDVLLPK